MPNRIIKESITTSKTLAGMSDSEERHFWRLLVQADDFGYMDADPDVIRARAYPMMLKQVSEDESEQRTLALVASGILHLFTCEDRRYAHFPTWDRHQQKRAKYSKYPHVTSCDINCLQMTAYVPEKRDIRSETLETRSETLETRQPVIRAEKTNEIIWDHPEWFSPMLELSGYKAGNHQKTCEAILKQCDEAGVPVEAVIQAWGNEYPNLRHRYAWDNPVTPLPGRPLAIIISNIVGGNNNGRHSKDTQQHSAPRHLE